MERREFLKAGLAAGAAGLAGGALGQDARVSGPFALDYAPHFGMFGDHTGGDLKDQLKFFHDEGFRSIEDNGMAGRSVEEQSLIAREMERLEMRMGVFVVNLGTAWGPTLSTGDAGARDKFLDECRVAVEVAKRVNAKWMTVVPGTVDSRRHWGYQMSSVMDCLKRGAEIFEPHGLVMVLEPLNRRDHPGLFLTDIGQAHAICKGVGSPSCKILYDVYHTQIQEGNIIPNFDAAWDEVAYVQVGDNPGRREPTTGEVNYARVFRHLKAKGYTGVVGMEHGVAGGGREGERACIDAYRSVDPR